MDQNDPLLQTILGQSGNDDPAESEAATAVEMHEGAPALSAALAAVLPPDDESDAPDDEIEAEDGSDEEQAPDYAGEIARREARIQELEASEDRYRREKDQALIEKANAAWKQAEQQALQAARATQDWEQAERMMTEFYNQRDAWKDQTYNHHIRAMAQPMYVQAVAKQVGLSEDDAAILATVAPEQIPAVAQALKAKAAKTDSELQAIRAEIKQLQRGRQSQRRAMTGQDRPSGSPRIPAAPRQFVPGSDEHTLAILALNQAVNGERQNGRR